MSLCQGKLVEERDISAEVDPAPPPGKKLVRRRYDRCIDPECDAFFHAHTTETLTLEDA